MRIWAKQIGSHGSLTLVHVYCQKHLSLGTCRLNLSVDLHCQVPKLASYETSPVALYVHSLRICWASNKFVHFIQAFPDLLPLLWPGCVQNQGEAYCSHRSLYHRREWGDLRLQCRVVWLPAPCRPLHPFWWANPQPPGSSFRRRFNFEEKIQGTMTIETFHTCNTCQAGPLRASLWASLSNWKFTFPPSCSICALKIFQACVRMSCAQIGWFCTGNFIQV